jgi:hypothetical protein
LSEYIALSDVRFGISVDVKSSNPIVLSGPSDSTPTDPA